MTITLTPSWILTDESAASSYKEPVLVKFQTGQVYGPDDVVQCYPSWPFETARKSVARMALTIAYQGGLEPEQQAFVMKFAGYAVSYTEETVEGNP